MTKGLLTLAMGAAIASSCFAQTTQRLPLIEGFSSNTCPPCASWNAQYTPILEQFAPNEPGTAEVAVLKYQMNWPSPGTDPSYNNMGNGRRTSYGVSGIPDWFIDGSDNGGSTSEIQNRINTPAELEVTAAYTLTGTTIDLDIEVTPLADLGSGYRLYIAIANKEYNYSGGTNGETEFHHVVRTMIPGGAGYGLSSLMAGTTQTRSASYTYTVASGVPAQSSYDLWDDQFEVVVWVQNAATKEVANATIASEGTLGIVDGDTDDFGAIVYPNPANEQATVMFDAAGEVNIEIFDNLGRTVLSQYEGNLQGRQRTQLNTSDLPAGLYYVNIRMDDKVAVQPLTIR